MPCAIRAATAWSCVSRLTLVSLMVANLRRGRAGRRLLAVRGNERAAAALGVSVHGAKLYGFSLAAGIAGLGGALLAFRSVTVNYVPFTGFASIQVVVISVIGGIGYVIGPLFAGPFAIGGIGGRITESIGFAPHDPRAHLRRAPHRRALRQPQRHRRHQRASDPPMRPAAAQRRTSPRTLDSSTTAIDLPGAVLAVRDLTVRFGGVVALDDVDLDVRPGEVLGLIGPNGAGKTTFIDAVTGFVATDPASAITLDGESIDGWSPTRRARAGLGRSFQSLELFEDITVAENLLVACDEQDIARFGIDLVHPGRPTLSPVALAAVREFGLDADLDAMPDTLPHGRRRLVAIARAVAAAPSVLLLDEPAAGLAAVETEELGRLVRWLAHDVGLAVLLIEHDVGLVLSTCDRVAVLDFGRLIALGTPDAIAQDPNRDRRLPRDAELMLDIAGLTVGYGDVPVVHGIDLQVAAGELVALLGPNGAGKTTTMLAIAGVLPSTGRHRLRGSAADGAPPPPRPARTRLHHRGTSGLPPAVHPHQPRPRLRWCRRSPRALPGARTTPRPPRRTALRW